MNSKTFSTLLGLSLLVGVPATAQETTAGGPLNNQASWTALRNMINATDGNVATLRTDVDALKACSLLGKVYAPEQTGADAQGCLSIEGTPAHAVMAFNLSSCPSGWTEYTPARGRFIRGIDASASVDPNGKRAPGSIQNDVFKAHTHGLMGSSDRDSRSIGLKENFQHGVSAETSSETHYILYNLDHHYFVQEVGDSETRPKNVSLLYCQKT